MEKELNVMKFQSVSKNSQVFQDKSLSPATGRITKKKKLTLREKIRKERALIGVTAIVTGSSIGLGAVEVHKLVDSMAVRGLSNEFAREVIEPNVHPTNDRAHFYYDYADIAHSIEDMGEDFDYGVYFVNDNMSRYVDNVLQYTEYGDFDHYLSSKGYKDKKEFEEDVKKQIVLDYRIDKQQEELDSMRQDHESVETEGYLSADSHSK